jgi:hypothetical protein
MRSLLQTLKHERRKTAESLRTAPTDQSLRWTLADIQNSIAAVEAVLDEEEPAEEDMRNLVIL